MANCLLRNLVNTKSFSKVNAISLLLVFVIASIILATEPAISAANITENYWDSKSSMHQPRSVLGVAAVDGKIYAIGGSNESGFSPSVPGYAVYGNINIDSFVNTNEEYDPTTDTWSYKAPMPTPRIAFATAVYQGKVYCIGGRSIPGSVSGGYTGVNEVYDPATDTWETKKSMPTARGWLGAGVINGKIYLIGGAGSNGILNEVYDPITDSWTSKASLPTPVEVGLGSVVTVMDNKLYVIGSEIQIYNPATDSWSKGASVPTVSWVTAAGATTGFLAPMRIYIIGLQDNHNPSNAVYNPENNSWTFGANTPTQRHNFAIAVVNDRLYVIGGHIYDVGRNGYFEPVALNEQYTPIGYSTLSSPSPNPSQSSSPSPSPHLPTNTSASPSPTTAVTPSLSPTQSPEPKSTTFPTEFITIAATITVIVIIVAITLTLKRKSITKSALSK